MLSPEVGGTAPRSGGSGVGHRGERLGRECCLPVERLMTRKLLTACLATLALGVVAAARPAEAASYAGAASTRCCPVSQECGGHIQYQLQRQTVLQNVQETVYDTQQVPCVREACVTL